MLFNSTHRFVVTARRPGLTSRRWAKTIAEAAAIAQNMEDNYAVVSIDFNKYFKA